MSIYIITPNTDDVVNKNDKNTQYTLKGVTNDIPTPAEFSALDAFADHFETEEGQIGDYARDHAMNSALSAGFTLDESTDCYHEGCDCSRNHA